MAEVVTGEAVVLDLAVARFPSRMAALAIDLMIQIAFLVLLLLIIVFGVAPRIDRDATLAIVISCYTLVVVGYPTIFETLTRGKTPGKMALGLRVVSDDGGPIRFRQALLRGLSLAFVEVWNPIATFGMPAGLITAMISAKGKRLGDLIAGTFVIQERVPRRAELAPGFVAVPPALLAWAQNLELSRLSDQTAAAASGYLRRLHEMRPAAREQLGWQLASSVAAQVSPPPPDGTPPVAYLSAVLAVRREREQARLARTGGAAVPGYEPWQPVRPVSDPAASAFPAGAAYVPSPAAAGQQPVQLPGYQPGIIPPLPDHPGTGQAATIGPAPDEADPLTPAVATGVATPAPTVSYTIPVPGGQPRAEPARAEVTEPTDSGFAPPV